MRPANLTRTSLLAIAALAPTGAPSTAATTTNSRADATKLLAAVAAAKAAQVTTPASVTTTPATTGVVTTTPATTTTPAVTAPVITTPAPATPAATPVPPPYLVPSPASLHVDLVAATNITRPQLPIPGLRVAALIAALLTLLLTSTATMLRWLGRPSPLAALGQGRRAQARRARRRRLAEDVRDWLRRSRWRGPSLGFRAGCSGHGLVA